LVQSELCDIVLENGASSFENHWRSVETCNDNITSINTVASGIGNKMLVWRQLMYVSSPSVNMCMSIDTLDYVKKLGE